MADVGSANIEITADDSDARQEVGGFFGFLRESASSVTRLIGSFAIFETIKNGLVGAAQSTIGANAEMEQYQNTLATVLKSSEKATETLAWAEKFAAQTPFEIPGIVEATTRLSAYGINAQDVLGGIGDMAAVMGKPLMQAVEAVADAQTGELERLKEFGITKQMLIDQAAEMGKGEIVNAKGQITDMAGLNEALFAIMRERFEGGMALQAQTFNGMLSNIRDSLGTMGRELSKPLFENLKEQMKSIVPVMGAATLAIKGDWVGVQQTLNDSFGPEVALKIENVFLAVSAGVHRAKEFIADLQPTVENLISIFNNLKPLLADIGMAIGAAFVGLMEVLPPILEQITAIFEAVTGWEGFIPTITGVVAAIGSYKGMMDLLTAAQALYDKVVAAGTLIQGAWTAATAASAAAGGGLRGVIAGLRAAMVALNISMLANPFVLVAALIIGLGVAFVQAYRHSETFRNIVNQAWASLKEGFAATINWFTTTLPAWVQSVVTWFVNLKNQVVAKVQELTVSAVGSWNNFKAGTMAVITSFIEAAVSFFGALRDRIMAIIQPFITFFVQSWENLKLLVLSIVTGLASLLVGDFEGMRLAVIGIVTALKNQALAIWQLFRDTTLQVILNLANGIKNGFESAKNWVISTVTSMKNQAVNDFNDLKTRAVNAAIGLKDGAINAVNNLKNGAINGFNSLRSGAVNAVNDTKNRVVSGFNEARSSAVNAVINLYNGVVSWLQNVPGKVSEMKNNMVSTLRNINLYQMGKDAIQGFINGIGAMIGSVRTKVGSVVEALKSQLTSKLKIGSPSKLLEQYGNWTFEGFVNGADNMIGKIKDVAGRAAEAIIPDSSALINGTVNPLNSVMPSLQGAVKGLIPRAGNEPTKIVIENVTTLDGREIARETHEYVTEFQQFEQNNNAIFEGRRVNG